jgi:hypothetical protein
MHKKIVSRPWKSPKDVKTVSFTKTRSGNLRRIGGNLFGNVFVGRIRFKDGRVHRVAIKKFYERLDDKKAAKYQKVILDLAKAGVRIPKMGMWKLPDGEWVQVSQLFGSTSRGSKIIPKSELRLRTTEGRIHAVKELMKVANIGYFPAYDFIEPFKEREKGIIPIDLDLLVREGRVSADKRSIEVKRCLVKMSLLETSNTAKAASDSFKVFDQLLKIAIKEASPKMKEALKKEQFIESPEDMFESFELPEIFP